MSGFFYFIMQINSKIVPMKNLLFMIVATALLFSACGSKDEKDEKKSEMSVCDCVKTFEGMMKEVEEAGGDEAKMKEIEEKYKDKAEACKKLGEGKSDEEKKKM